MGGHGHTHGGLDALHTAVALVQRVLHTQQQQGRQCAQHDLGWREGWTEGNKGDKLATS